MPYLEASFADPNYRLCVEGMFQKATNSPIRNSQTDDIEIQLQEMLCDMMQPDPCKRPSIKEILARPLWGHGSF
jgi:hypothetical protein